MNITLNHFMISVKDMQKSTDFYKDILGFTVDDKTEEWSELSHEGSTELAFRMTNNAEVAGGAGIGFFTDSCEEVSKELESKVVSLLKRCEERSDGTLLTQIEDPDKNIIWFAQKK